MQWHSQERKTGDITDFSDQGVIDLQGNDDLLYWGSFFDFLRRPS